MTVHEANARALAAVETGDLDALSQALADRDRALRIASPAEQAAALRDGTILALRIAELKRNLAAEHARLATLRDGLASYSASSRVRCIDLRG